MKRILFTYVLLCLTGAAAIVRAQVPVITSAGKDTIVCQGGDITFTVTATNSPTQYKWQCSDDIVYMTWDDLSSSQNFYSGMFSGYNTNSVIAHTGNFPRGMSIILRCIVSNTDGSSTPSPIYEIRIAQPHPGFTIGGPGTVCLGSTGNIFGGGVNYDIDSVIWSYTGTGASIHRNYETIHKPWDSSIVIDFSYNATSGLMSARDSNACGIYNSEATTIAIGPPRSTVAGAVGYAPICNISYSSGFVGIPNQVQSACAPVLTFVTSGTNPVQGNIKSCVEMDAAVQSFNGIPYVQRHYSIEPQDIDGSTSTATLTLYFTQDDFDAYNLARAGNPALPTGSTDATGIANLRVTQFHGTGTDPGTYVGSSGEIDPDDNNIVWNASASRWEVTFDITGFSGFFISTGSLTPLPLTLISFSGQSVTDGNLLQWTTSSEQNTRSFEIQKNEGNSFQPLASIPAAGNSQQSLNYSYTDPVDGSASYSYRLKMIDIDGKFTYSKTITMQSNLATLSIRVSPNPFHQSPSLIVRSPKAANAMVTVTDISGKLLLQQNISLLKGENSLETGRIAALPQGVYLLSVTTDQQIQTVKFIRE